MISIINTYDQIMASGGTGILIVWFSDKRTGNKYSVMLYRDGKELPTNPSAPWFDHGRKTFSPFNATSGNNLREDKAWALKQAQDWIAANYPDLAPKEWAKNRMGDYISADINKKFPIPKRAKNTT